jgi:pectin methylesterase-like acyl-CoA thioesterase
MVADARLVDARTGAVIIANPDLTAVLYAGQGIVGTAVQAAIDSASDKNVVEKLVDRYGESYRDWLLRRA